jgi:hypothetical protein
MFCIDTKDDLSEVEDADEVRDVIQRYLSAGFQWNPEYLADWYKEAIRQYFPSPS